jgi:hypothetical protein
VKNLLIALLAFLALGARAEVEPKRAGLGAEPVQSVLWVGNSFFFFNNGIHRYVTGLSNAAGKENRVRSVLTTIGGSGIDWHDLDAYLKPGSKMGWYSFVGDNEIVFNKPGRQFDTVVVMDCSQCPIHPQLKAIFHEYAAKDSEIARKYGVRPVFFMSWAYKDAPEMTAKLSDAYTTEANANDALVIPAGRSPRRSRSDPISSSTSPTSAIPRCSGPTSLRARATPRSPASHPSATPIPGEWTRRSRASSRRWPGRRWASSTRRRARRPASNAA